MVREGNASNLGSTAGRIGTFLVGISTVSVASYLTMNGDYSITTDFGLEEASVVQISINIPQYVAPGDNITATVDIATVASFDAADSRVSFNATVLQQYIVTAGLITGNVSGNLTAMPVDYLAVWQQPSGTPHSETHTIINNVSGTPRINGSGYLVVLLQITWLST